MKNNQNLFFSPEEKGRAFSDVLKEVQEYISSKYSTLMVEGGSEEVKQQVKRYITKYICDLAGSRVSAITGPPLRTTSVSERSYGLPSGHSTVSVFWVSCNGWPFATEQPPSLH